MSLFSIACPECNEKIINAGDGKCNVCNGSGVGNIFDVEEILGASPGCERCGGSGECPRCGGTGITND